MGSLSPKEEETGQESREEMKDKLMSSYQGDTGAAVKTKNAQPVKLVVGKRKAVFKDPNKIHVCDEHYGIIGEVLEGNKMKSKVLTPKCVGMKICLVDENQDDLWVFKENVERECFQRGLEELENQVDAVERRKGLKT